MPVCDIAGLHRPAADQSETDTALILAELIIRRRGARETGSLRSRRIWDRAGPGRPTRQSGFFGWLRAVNNAAEGTALAEFACCKGALVVPGMLCEREDELARVDALMTAACAGRGGVLLIAGPAGIGKTVLLEAARERAAQGPGKVVN